MGSSPLENTALTPEETEAQFRVREGLYLVGSLERGVTVYRQQIRAHNLVWALWELNKSKKIALNNIAIVGGGIAGLTVAACIISLFKASEARVALFEQRWDLCPIQQGADGRWLHPHIYDWPFSGSRAPSASLPVLNWSEGRASDVAQIILKTFGEYYTNYADNRLEIYLGVNHLRLRGLDNHVEWVGAKASLNYGTFQTVEPVGKTEKFDAVIMCPGFGLEERAPPYLTPSYWRNEQLAQPNLNGARTSYLISGYGDGALIDLCRLTIGRFRQDTILYELFGRELEQAESAISKLLTNSGSVDNAFAFMQHIESPYLEKAKIALSARVRRDTNAILHMGGRKMENRSIADAFGGGSSFLNRMLLFLLFRCGAVSIAFGSLEDSIRHYEVSMDKVLCRYGARTMSYILQLFSDPAEVEDGLQSLESKQGQIRRQVWVPGCFPHLTPRS